MLSFLWLVLLTVANNYSHSHATHYYSFNHYGCLMGNGRIMYSMSKQLKNEHFPDEQVTMQALSYILCTINKGFFSSVMDNVK